jgi:Helix-turn-helix domain
MSADSKPLFVRLAADDADRLDAAVAATGKSKRRLVSEAMREHLARGAHLAGGEHLSGGEPRGRDELTVGRISLLDEGRTPLSGPDGAAPPTEVMTLPEAAAFLRLEEAQLERSAANSEVPARRVAGQWRFSRAALLAWLDSAARLPGEET